jgi:hypothetical protein
VRRPNVVQCRVQRPAAQREGECQLPARTAPVPSSKIGLDQVLGGEGCGLLDQSAWRYLRRGSSIRLYSALHRSCKSRASLRRTRLFCMLGAHGSGRRFDQAWWESQTVHGMTATPDSREEVALNRSSPNNRIERGVTHKVLRRGRDSIASKIVMRARVRDALACARSCERWAT